jgi:hypothetical protein
MYKKLGIKRFVEELDVPADEERELPEDENNSEKLLDIESAN